jgi:peptide/nickel transport system substrate-binding protein
VALLALLASACGDDSGTATDDAGAGGASTTVNTAAIDPTAIFRVAWVQPTSLDPHKSSIAADLYVLEAFYDRLVHQSPDVQAIPGLASSWSFSADGTRMNMKLRNDVTFHDGTPFNAAAVKANIDRALTLPTSAVKSDLGSVDKVEVVGDYEVSFVLKGPAASLPLVLSAQAGMMISPAALNNADLDQKPVGAGMFKVTANTPGSKITGVAYDKYWDKDAVKVAGIEVHIMPDFNARMNALRDGSIDAARIDPGQADQAKSAGLKVIEQDSIEIGMVNFNRAKAPFDKVEVRQALNYAIDREAMVKGLFFGLGTVNPQPYPIGFWANDPSLPANYYKFDQAKAKSMLAAAGYPNGFDMQLNVANVGYVVAWAENIQAQLKAIGVNATINKVDVAQYGAVVYQQAVGNATAVIGASRADPSQTALQFTTGAFTNPGGASSPDVDRLYKESLDQKLTNDQRQAKLRELSKVLTEQAFAIFMFNPKNAWATGKNVVGLQSYRNVFEYRGVAKTK